MIRSEEIRMKVIGVVPARYESTRMPGKPLADICGKPMIWWVYNRVKKSKKLDEVYVAIDDERIAKVCEELQIKYIMTSNEHPNHIARIHEVSTKILADYYICINGDEPLIEPAEIEKIIPKERKEKFYFGGAMRILKDPAQTIDFSNIKVVVNEDNRAVYMSRTPVPYPKGTLTIKYNKYIGIECFNRKALDFFVTKPMGILEAAEDIDHLRFIENGMPIYFTYVDSEAISVDTPKDLSYIIETIRQNKINE